MDHAVLIFTGGLFHKLKTTTAKNLSLLLSFQPAPSNIQHHPVCLLHCSDWSVSVQQHRHVLSAHARFSNQVIQTSNWILLDRKLVKSNQNKFDMITFSLSSQKTCSQILNQQAMEQRLINTKIQKREIPMKS